MSLRWQEASDTPCYRWYKAVQALESSHSIYKGQIQIYYTEVPACKL